MFTVLLLLGNMAPQAAEAKFPSKTETFTWRYGTSVLGELNLPRGFTADTSNYREGIVTTLSYPDGSSIVLQKGFMYRIPMFQDPEHVLDSSEKDDAKTTRKGHYAGKAEAWGEVDYKSPMKIRHPGQSYFGAVGPNLGYAHVPRKRTPEFAKALQSFRPPDDGK